MMCVSHERDVTLASDARAMRCDGGLRTEHEGAIVPARMLSPFAQGAHGMTPVPVRADAATLLSGETRAGRASVCEVVT
jgi:hypothetical protein